MQDNLTERFMLHLKSKLDKPKFSLRLKEKAAPPPSKFAPLSPILKDWLEEKSKPGPYLGEIDMSAVPAVKGSIKCYWIGSREWIGVIWPNEGRHVSSIQVAWPEDILTAFQNMKRYGTVEAPGFKLRFKQPEVKTGFRLKLKPKNDRTLWYHPESNSYVECLNEEEARKVSRECDEVTGDVEHENKFHQQKLKESTAAQEPMPDTTHGGTHVGRLALSRKAGNERPSGRLSLKSPVSVVDTKPKLSLKSKLSLKLKPKLELKRKG